MKFWPRIWPRKSACIFRPFLRKWKNIIRGKLQDINRFAWVLFFYVAWLCYLGHGSIWRDFSPTIALAQPLIFPAISDFKWFKCCDFWLHSCSGKSMKTRKARKNRLSANERSKVHKMWSQFLYRTIFNPLWINEYGWVNKKLWKLL